MGGIEGDPTGARQVDLSPGVGGPSTLGQSLGIEEIAGHRTGAESEAADSFDQQGREVATGPAARGQGLTRRLDTLLVTGLVEETAPSTPALRSFSSESVSVRSPSTKPRAQDAAGSDARA
jgi:hypothetical protein